MASYFPFYRWNFLFLLYFLVIDVLCSVSVEGQLYVWKIFEAPDEKGTPQIVGNIVISVQINEEPAGADLIFDQGDNITVYINNNQCS